jgi:hypothetical protein
LLLFLHLTTILSEESQASNMKTPIILKASLNPSKVQIGDNMKITATVFDFKCISKVRAKIFHEKGFDIIDLSLIDGSNKIGIWHGTWQVHDTIIKDYNAIITAYSYSGLNSSVCKIWSDPIPWWNENWILRKIHKIIGSADGNLENYTVKIVTHKSSGTDSNENVYLGSNVRDDFGDVRFIDDSGNELDYLLDFLNSGDNATFWVEIPSIPTNPNTVNVSVYYNNPTETSNSDIKDTFPQAIDFGSDSIISYGGSQDSGGNGEWTTDADENYIRFGLGSNRANNWKAVNAGNLNIVSGDYRICFWYKSDSGEAEISGVGHDTETSTIEQGKTYQTEGTQSWGINDIDQYNRGAGGWQYLDAVLNDYIGSHSYLTIAHDNDGGPNTDDYFKNIRVRKYTSNEPTHGEWGNEEMAIPTKPSLTSPTNNTSTDDDTPTFEWTNEKNTEIYTLLVDSEIDLSDDDEWINVSLDSSIETYTVPGGNSLSEGKWYWKVVANNTQGKNSSDTWRFIVDNTPPLVVNLSSPINLTSTDNNQITFSWNITLDDTTSTPFVSNIACYQLQVDDSQDFSTPLIDDNTSDNSSLSLTRQISGRLFWRVRAWDQAGNAGPFSEVRKLTVFNFDLGASSTTLQIQRGGSSSTTISVDLVYGDNENVTLESFWSGAVTPSYISVNFDPQEGNVSFSSTVTFDCGSSASTGTFTCMINGTSVSGIKKIINISITIYTMLFSIDGFPRTLSLIRSDESTATISVEFDQGALETVTLSGDWIGDTPNGVTVSYSITSGTPPYDSIMTITTSKSAEAGSFVYRVTGSASGLTKTVNFYVNILTGLTVNAETDKDTYEKGEKIKISGVVRDENENLVSSGTATISLAVQDWEYSFTTSISSGIFSTNYYITFDKPDGNWVVSVTATDSRGHITASSTNMSIAISTPENYNHYSIDIISPLSGQFFKRGETVTFTVSVSLDTVKIIGAEVKAFTISGEEIILTEISPGLYSTSYDLGYDSALGNWSLYVEGTKIEEEKLKAGFNFVNFEVQPIKPIIELIEPKTRTIEVGEEIDIIVKINYPDGSPVEEGVVTALSKDGKTLLFTRSRLDLYSLSYTRLHP